MKLILSTLFLTAVFLCYGQEKYTISGTVYDAESGESLIAATVRIKELPQVGIYTNSYGYYSLTVEKGTYTLLVKSIGFEQQEIPLDLNADKKMDFKLTADNMLQAVEVKGEKNNANITNDQIGVDKLDVNEIKKIPVLFGEQDVLKTLQLKPGVKSLGEGSGGLYVRGGDNSQNLILLDEATIYNANHLLGFFSTFNSDAIKDLTLYKGTAPTNYGGRLSSVMDVKMNEGNNQNFHVGGGIGLISSRLNIEGPIIKDKASFLVTGRRTYADLFLKLSSDDAINSNQLYFYDLNAKANYKINDNNRILLSGYFGRDVLSFQDRFGIDWGNVTGTVRWNHLWNQRLFSNTSLIYSDYDYKVSLFGDDAEDFSITSYIKNWNLKHEFQFYANNKNTFNFGLNASFNDITPGQVETSEDSDIQPIELENRYSMENSLFFSHNYRPNKRWNFTYGLRATAFNLLGPGNFYSYDENGSVTDTTVYSNGDIVATYVNLEPRFNAAYIINESMSLKTAYTRNTQNLHLISNSNSSTPTDIWIASSNNVKPEIADQVSLGLFKNFAKNKYQFSTEIYGKLMQNQLDLRNGAEINANEHIEGELLFGQGRAYGAEFLLQKKTGKLTGWIGYTLSRTEKQIDGINNGEWYAAKQDATHDVSVVGIYDINKKWSVSATWVFNTGNAVTFPSGKYEVNGEVEFYYTERNGYRMPNYHRLDLGATRTFNKREKFESSLNFSLYNAYGRKNAYTIDFQEDPNDPTKTVAVKTYLFTFMPSITYNFKF